MKNINERIELVKAMELIARSINDENIFMEWLIEGIADGDTDFEWYTDDERYADLMKTFLVLMTEANKSGGLYSNGIVSRHGYIY